MIVGHNIHAKMPTTWEAYLDALVKMYLDVHPDKKEAYLVGSKDPNAMEIDTSEKKSTKNKGKGKEVTSTERTRKYCDICKRAGHNTQDCYYLAKNHDKAPAKFKLRGERSKDEEKNKKREGTSKTPSTPPKKKEQYKKQGKIYSANFDSDEEDSDSDSRRLT